MAFVAFVLLSLDLEEEVEFIAHVLQTESRSCFGDPMSLVLLGSLPSDAEERTNIFADLQRGEVGQIKRHTCHTCLKPLWRKALRAVAFHGPNATPRPKRHTNATPRIRHSVRGIHRCHHYSPFLESPLYGAADGLWAGLWIPSGAVVDAADASGV